MHTCPQKVPYIPWTVTILLYIIITISATPALLATLAATLSATSALLATPLRTPALLATLLSATPATTIPTALVTQNALATIPRQRHRDKLREVWQGTGGGGC